MVIWITGRKHSGKTTLARRLARQLDGVILDGDEVRDLCDNQDYTDAGREFNQRKITKRALELERKGHTVIIACVSPKLALRQELQAQFKECIEIELPFGELWPGTTYEESPL